MSANSAEAPASTRIRFAPAFRATVKLLLVQVVFEAVFENNDVLF